PLQIRAVSSPSLTEPPVESQSNTSPKYSIKPEPNGNIPNQSELNERSHQQSASSGSVLQKFKKTFFKNGKSNVPSADNNLETNESKHHRFGPLVWRSSKERRKTKSHRRDKCNSGDSGIQVELENDENLSENVPSMDVSPQHTAKVRRANSAKLSTATSTRLENKSDNKTSSVQVNTKRSLSQPSDLDVIVCDKTKKMNDLEKLKHIDDDDDDGDDDGSDTDSLTSNHVEEIEDDGQHSLVYAEVLYQFQAGGPQELSLEKGTLVEVLKRETGPWWWGRTKYEAVVTGDNSITIQHGWFPKDFVKVMPSFGNNRKLINSHSSSEYCDNQLVSLPPTSAAPSISSSQSNSEIMKDNVIKELLETEINYVKLLNSLVEGFIKEMKDHPEVFSLESIFLIFSNMEQIYRFQQTFLEALRLAIPNGRIAEVFLEFQSAFMVYSQYCNSYPRALMELENFSGNKEASAILESCRVAQNLPELPLSAHLLAPIQRICRYPLHLSELVKHSKSRKEILLKLDVHQLSKNDLETIDSKEIFEVALSAMKRVTEMVNEGKRHSEYLSRMQSRFENFQGPSINVHSTRLFLQTDAIRVSPNLWNNTYTLFLFDRQLVYCKKDLLKRTSYIYKGRIFLDNCRILNLPDGKMFGVNLKNALRMFCETRGKWFDFCFRSSSSKMRFLNTLSAERQFCGSSLFVSELAPGLDDDNLSDDANGQHHQEYDERGIDVDPNFQLLIGNVAPNLPSMESPVKQPKFSDTLPKKPRKLSKEAAPSQIIIDYNPSATSSNMNKRRLGNWFRKSKSTNSTPSQSPTHHPLVATATVPSIVNHSDSNSSSQSSPVNYPRTQFKEAAVGATS
ncbi:CLUMA_CG004007, isoform A, partial [Clunio marinus]